MNRPDVVLDTCCVIYLATGRRLARPALTALMRAGERSAIGLSVVTAWELGLASSPTRKYPLVLTPTPKDFVRDVFGRRDMIVIELSADVAFEASHLPDFAHRDPGDRLLVATARALAVPLMTDDARILEYAARGHVKAIAC